MGTSVNDYPDPECGCPVCEHWERAPEAVRAHGRYHAAFWEAPARWGPHLCKLLGVNPPGEWPLPKNYQPPAPPPQPAPPPAPAWSPLRASTRRPPRRELVVSHYAADLSWLAEVPASVDAILVYSKGPELRGLPADPRIGLVARPNFGREAETIASHVAANTPAGTTFFAQDDPFDHSPDFLQRLSLDYDRPTSLTTRYLPDVPPDWIKALDLVEFHQGHEVRYGDALIEHQDASSPSRRWFDPAAWDYLFAGPIPRPLWFGYGAMWAVPAAFLRARPAWFWYQLAAEIVRGELSRPGSSVTVPPLNPWSLEALWRPVFDPSVPLRWRAPAVTSGTGCGSCGQQQGESK